MLIVSNQLSGCCHVLLALPAVYTRLVQRLLRLGTTTANYFTTIHPSGCKVLADTVLQLGQRAVIGKVCMDQHGPDFYLDQGVADSLAGAREVVQYVQVCDPGNCMGHLLCAKEGEAGRVPVRGLSYCWLCQKVTLHVY